MKHGALHIRKQRTIRTAEAVARVLLFAMAVMAAAQALHAIDIALSKEPEPVATSNEQVSDILSVGYVQANTAIPQPESNEGLVLAAMTVRSVIDIPDFRAELVEQNITTLNITEGKAATIEVAFKNTGRATWENTGPHYIAMNVTNPAGRHSPVQHSFWNTYYYRPGRLAESIVVPGQIGHFRFAVKAPSAPGAYVEDFGLVAENLAWIEGGEFSLTVVIESPPPLYAAKLTDQSNTEITLAPGETQNVWIDYRNTGILQWNPDDTHFIALNATDPSGRQSAFQADSWSAYYRPAVLGESVDVGSTGRIAIAIDAPLSTGIYTETYQLVAENFMWLENTRVTFTITVRDPVRAIETFEDEPQDFRVGLYSTDDLVKVSGDKPVDVVNADGDILTESVAADTAIHIRYEDGRYTTRVDGEVYSSTTAVRVESVESDTILTIIDYVNSPGWNDELNDNTFRNIIEVRYSSETDKVWVINELPLEQYLRGIAESGNTAPVEFLQAMAVAERTYALYHYLTGTKHADEGYHVDAMYDQVYRGYGLEVRAPNITDAVIESAGKVITYEDEIVVTPYFSNTDGRTRSWEEVWAGGPYPWLVSVPDPYCEGLELHGHGVGMSARGALEMAADGADAHDILTHYYTDITVVDFY